MDFENCIVVNLQQDSFKCFCVEKSSEKKKSFNGDRRQLARQ